MQQVRITRKASRRGGDGEPVADLPLSPASDTAAATRVLAAIDAALAA